MGFVGPTNYYFDPERKKFPNLSCFSRFSKVGTPFRMKHQEEAAASPISKLHQEFAELEKELAFRFLLRGPFRYYGRRIVNFGKNAGSTWWHSTSNESIQGTYAARGLAFVNTG